MTEAIPNAEEGRSNSQYCVCMCVCVCVCVHACVSERACLRACVRVCVHTRCSKYSCRVYLFQRQRLEVGKVDGRPQHRGDHSLQQRGVGVVANSLQFVHQGAQAFLAVFQLPDHTYHLPAPRQITVCTPHSTPSKAVVCACVCVSVPNMSTDI